MYDQFDDKLSSRIKDVFDNYEDETADFGWEELRKRFPGKEEKKVISAWWWKSAAAVLLLTMGTWAFVANQPEIIYLVGKSNPGTEVITQPKFDKKNNNQEVKASVSTPALPAIIEEKAPASYSVVSITPSISEAKTTSKNGYMARTAEPSVPNNTLSVISVIPEESNEQTIVVAPIENNASMSPAEEKTSDSMEKLIITALIENKESVKKSNNSLFADAPEASKPEAKKTKQFSIGVFAGSYFNYAEGSESSVNTGIGISSEIGITKKLKLTTGVSIAQNTLKYNSIIPESATAAFSSVARIEEDEALKSGFGAATPTTYSINKYNASLLGLDIPVNLKYTLLQNKNELYLVAGFSSNLFIEESYKYSYEVNSGKNSNFAEQEDPNATAKFKNFDFARMLNLSVGFGRPVGKQNRLSFEPFVKYPLAGQGARDLRFGSAGMNLKLNFSTSRIKK